MNESYNFLEELEDFLAGTFHQDISSPEEALDEFIEEASKECLLFTIKYCEEFLSSELTEQEKENIIQNNADIYFPAIELTPLQWLNQLVKKITEDVKIRLF
ncbi:contact-dependent growth inhibition system immunity protein [Priestia filamentosa]|uniref:contact-dependent growth inhibition system immunity protein n=1 Tax=Priestia filamentosa TaxID=1402861 RepID=UPI00234AB6A1|nr:contact-dependent growth inhibition system immunity protein [Priestia filamentosa]WCM17653.1 contact-dependent growth inhibition system immunity protein [Priestia filamentosa]